MDNNRIKNWRESFLRVVVSSFEVFGVDSITKKFKSYVLKCTTSRVKKAIDRVADEPVVRNEKCRRKKNPNQTEKLLQHLERTEQCVRKCLKGVKTPINNTIKRKFCSSIRNCIDEACGIVCNAHNASDQSTPCASKPEQASNKNAGTSKGRSSKGTKMETRKRKSANLLYYCMYCADAGVGIAYNSSESIKKHWCIDHRHYEHVQPYRFYAVEMASCYYCSHTASWKDLIKHHNELHSQKEFTIVSTDDGVQCVMCTFKGESMTEHFKKHHSTIKVSPIFNPLPMKIARSIDFKASPIAHISCCNKDIEKCDLLEHKLKHKNVRCPYCRDFASDDMFVVLSHARQHSQFDPIKTIDKFQCSVLADLWETKVVFRSGLTLFYCNLINTKIDPKVEFQQNVKDWTNALTREFFFENPN